MPYSVCNDEVGVRGAMATENATEQEQQTEAPAVTRTRAKPLLASAAIVLGLGIAAMIWHAGHHPAPGAVSTSHGADGVTAVALSDFSGNLTVLAGGSAQIAATAQPVSGDRAPGLEFHLNASTHLLTLACYDQNGGQAIPCPATQYKISLPAGMGLNLIGFTGQATLTDLSGPVDLSGKSVYVDAQGLKTPSFTATVTSGTLNAAFAQAPAKVDVAVTSAQATLHLPGTVSYAVRQQTTSGYVQVSIPQSNAATRTVLAAANSGEISLLTN